MFTAVKAKNRKPSTGFLLFLRPFLPEGAAHSIDIKIIRTVRRFENILVLPHEKGGAALAKYFSFSLREARKR